jgi:hypothetical protein
MDFFTDDLDIRILCGDTLHIEKESGELLNGTVSPKNTDHREMNGVKKRASPLKKRPGLFMNDFRRPARL